MYLLPFYKRVSAQMRKGDAKRLVFYEPVVWDYLSGGFEDNLGFPEREVYSYHVYCSVISATTGEPVSRTLCDIIDTTVMATKEKAVREMKIGAFLTEFGAVKNTTMSAAELDIVLNGADTYLRSWAHWQYKGNYISFHEKHFSFLMCLHRYRV
jgi:endoglycosylceramidase